MYIPFLHHWHFHWQRRKIRDQKGLWFTSFFHQMGFALMHIFSIVFIYEFGSQYFWRANIKSGILLVLLYLVCLFIVPSVGAIWLGNGVIRKIGYRKSIGLSLLFTASGYLFLALADWTQMLPYIPLAALVKGVGLSLYWPTYYTLFTGDVSSESVGGAFGVLDACAKLGQVIAPLIGALLAIYFGFTGLFVAGILLLMTSGVPMFFLKHHLHFDSVSWSEYSSWLRERSYKRFVTAIVGRNTYEKLLISVWPIYVFIVIGTLEGIGRFQSLVLLASMVFTYIIAKSFDKRHDRKVQVMGVAGNVFFSLARIFASTVWLIIIIDTVDRFFEAMSRTFFFGYLFKRARGHESFSFMIYWVTSDSFGFTLILMFLALVLITTNVAIFWLVMLVTMSLGSTLSLLIEDHQ